MIAVESPSNIYYPSEDGEPLAETQQHALAILMTLSVLSLYLREKKAVVFADQFLYYVEGDPSARVAPDVMVVFDIPLKLYNHYKLWEYGSIPAVIFEITSESTKLNDLNVKTKLYQKIGVPEYWLFDLYGEWIEGQLIGYRLSPSGDYEIITDRCSRVLGLELLPEGHLISFYRLDNKEKLLTPEELFLAKQIAEQKVKEAQEQAELERQRADRLAQKLKDLGIDID